MSRIPLSIIQAAQAGEAKWGIPSSITLAQWALESGWGKKDLGAHNYFGIKARKGQPCVMKRTREVIKGKEIYVFDPFRAFSSPAECFDAHGELLATGRPYAKCRAKLPNVNAFADSLTGVYATDPKYGQLLRQLMGGKDNMYQYNGPAFR